MFSMRAAGAESLVTTERGTARCMRDAVDSWKSFRSARSTLNGSSTHRTPHAESPPTRTWGISSRISWASSGSESSTLGDPSLRYHTVVDGDTTQFDSAELRRNAPGRMSSDQLPRSAQFNR